MGFVKYVATALSVASVTAAASCSTATTTLSNGGDATALAACSTFSGNIVVETGAAEPGAQLSLDGLVEIDGELTYMNDASVQTISASTLKKITGDFTLSNLTSLSTLDLGSLATVGNVKFSGLGSLTSLGFGNPGVSSAGNVTIQNTQIGSLMGIANASQLAGIDITDNGLLSEISLAATSIDTILIGPNDVSSQQGVSFAAPNLASSGTIVIRNCSSVSVPALQEVSDILALIENTLQTFIAPNMTWAGGLVIDDNENLKNLSFPSLVAINGSNSTLDVANNTVLSEIDGFPVLATVNGGVNLAGNFSEAKFPKITRIGGALTIDTSSTTFNCGDIPGTGSQIVRGQSQCTKSDAHPNTGSGTSSGSGSATTTSSIAQAGPIPANFMPVFGIIAGLLFV